MPIEGVAATGLCDGISITLVRENGGWRFSAWSAHYTGPIEVVPKPDHTRMRFATFHDGVMFFRGHYAALFTAKERMPEFV